MLSEYFHSCPFWKSFLDDNPSRLFCQRSMQRQGLSVLWLFSEDDDWQMAFARRHATGNKWHSSTNPIAGLSRHVCFRFTTSAIPGRKIFRGVVKIIAPKLSFPPNTCKFGVSKVSTILACVSFKGQFPKEPIRSISSNVSLQQR